MELADEQWARIEPLLQPKRQGRGRPRADDRAVLNGIRYVRRTGCRWEDVPRRYGSPATCWRCLRDWEADGTWERVWQTLLQSLLPPKILKGVLGNRALAEYVAELLGLNGSRAEAKANIFTL